MPSIDPHLSWIHGSAEKAYARRSLDLSSARLLPSFGGGGGGRDQARLAAVVDGKVARDSSGGAAAVSRSHRYRALA